MSDEEIDSEPESEDEVQVTMLLGYEVDDEGYMTYRCRVPDGGEALYDRSDLMDFGRLTRMVLDYERRHPPPWDEHCPYCDDTCEECECDCGRVCRFIKGVNYGCPKHPVV